MLGNDSDPDVGNLLKLVQVGATSAGGTGKTTAEMQDPTARKPPAISALPTYAASMTPLSGAPR